MCGKVVCKVSLVLVVVFGASFECRPQNSQRNCVFVGEYGVMCVCGYIKYERATGLSAGRWEWRKRGEWMDYQPVHGQSVYLHSNPSLIM